VCVYCSSPVVRFGFDRHAAYGMQPCSEEAMDAVSVPMHHHHDSSAGGRHRYGRIWRKWSRLAVSRQHRSTVSCQVLIASVERRHCFPIDCLRHSAVTRHFTTYRRWQPSGLWRRRHSAFSSCLSSMLHSRLFSRTSVADRRTDFVSLLRNRVTSILYHFFRFIVAASC